MTPEQALRNLYQKSLAYQGQVKNYLNEQFGPQNPTGKSSEQLYREGVERMGGFVWDYGKPVTDTQVNDYIKRTGGNPYAKSIRELQSKLQQSQAATPKMPSDRAGRQAFKRRQKEIAQQAEAAAQAGTPLDTLIAEYKKANDAAFAANESRYNQGLQELTDLRTRNMGRVENFGVAARGDLERRASQSLANIQADLADRGLGNSTTMDSFSHANAVDLAREQQRLSEMVDDRAARYDEGLTNNLVGFVERRNDIPPDYSQLYALAEKYGAAGQSGASGGTDQAGAVGQAGASAPLQNYTVQVPRRGMPNLPYAMSPWGAQMVAANTVGQLPDVMQRPVDIAQGASGMAYGVTGMPVPTYSNRYPQTRTPAQYLQTSFNDNLQRLQNINRARSMNRNWNLRNLGIPNDPGYAVPYYA